MGSQKLLFCRHCGNLAGLVRDNGAPLLCCGEIMKEHVPNTVEASVEKHLPVIEAVGDKMAVSVGSAPHPMTEEHYIAFVYAETKNGGQRKGLRPGGEPAAVFAFVEDSPVAVYAYCNLHGLWKTEV